MCGILIVYKSSGLFSMLGIRMNFMRVCLLMGISRCGGMVKVGEDLFVRNVFNVVLLIDVFLLMIRFW